MRIHTSTGVKTTFVKLFETFWPSLEGKSARITLAPCLERRSTVARPNPDAPPVTRAVTPCGRVGNNLSLRGKNSMQCFRRTKTYVDVTKIASKLGVKNETHRRKFTN